jgi:hypothetical protein
MYRSVSQTILEVLSGGYVAAIHPFQIVDSGDPPKSDKCEDASHSLNIPVSSWQCSCDGLLEHIHILSWFIPLY